MVDRTTMYKRPNLNLLQLLRDRQAYAAAPGTQVHCNRQLYTRIYPNKLSCQLQDCQLHLIRFSPCGCYLIAIDTTQHDLVVYAVSHPSWSYSGEQPEGESPQQLQALIGQTQPLDQFFQLQYRVRLTNTNDLLCKDFCLVVLERFLLVASATPATEPPPGETGPSAGLPLVTSTIFHLIDLVTGAQLDQLVLHDDLVNLSVQHGVSILQDMVAIVAVRSQRVLLMHVQPAGRLVPLQSIGETCFADDELVLARAADAEARWQQHNAESRPPSRHTPRPGSAAHEAAASSGPSLLHGPGPHTSTAAAAGHPLGSTHHAVQPNGTDRVADSETDSTERQRRPAPPTPDTPPAMLSGIRHRLLAHCFRKAAAAGPQELRRLFYEFEGLSSLLMLRAQFLDSDHLLLSMGKPHHWLGRGGDGTSRSAGLLVYNWRQGTVIEYLSPKDPNLARLCVQLPSWFAPELGDSEWLRCITPGGLPYPQRQIALATVRDQQAGMGGMRSQDCEAIVAMLPSTSQQHQASPYLETQLFQYDEQHVSAAMASRRFTGQVIKFTSRQAPDRLRFRLDLRSLGDRGQGRGSKMVRCLFHPWAPMVLVMLHSARSAPETVVVHWA